MEGWFKIHRIIFENGLWSNPADLRLFMWLVGHAVHSENGQRYGDVRVKRGQYLRSYRKLQEDLQYVENHQIKTPALASIKRSIERLVDSNRITILGTELGTLFTILNYEKYQATESKNETFKYDAEDKKEELGTGLGTVAEQQRNNNKNDKNVEEVINVQIEFERFWNLYDKKVSKHKSIKLWNRLSVKDKELIFKCLPVYINATPDKQYRKNPDTYLRNRSWTDEIYQKKSTTLNIENKPASHQYL